MCTCGAKSRLCTARAHLKGRTKDDDTWQIASAAGTDEIPSSYVRVSKEFFLLRNKSVTGCLSEYVCGFFKLNWCVSILIRWRLDVAPHQVESEIRRGRTANPGIDMFELQTS